MPRAFSKLFTLLTMAIVGAGAAWLALYLLPDYGLPYPYHLAGDYGIEADPTLVHSSIWHLYNVDPTPLMTPLSLVIRKLSLIVADELHFSTATQAQRYLTSSLVLVWVSFLIVAFSSLRSLQFSRESLQAMLLGAVAILNPLSLAAILSGHPEEVLLAAFICAAGFALYRQRFIYSAVLLSLAVAVKQPAVLLVPLFFLAWPTGARKRSSITLIITAILAIVPWTILDLHDFLVRNLFDAGQNTASLDQDYDIFTVLHLNQWSPISRPLLIILVIGIPFWIASRNNTFKVKKPNFWQLSYLQTACLLPALLLLRCLLDPANIDYYAAPAVVSLMLLELILSENMNHPLQLLSNKIAGKKSAFCFPALTIGLSFWLVWFSGGVPPRAGFVSNWVSTHLANDPHALFYLIATLPIVILLILLAAGFKSIRSRKTYFYAAAGFCTVIVLFLTALVQYNPPAHKLIRPLYGLDNVSLRSLTLAENSSVADKSYWLGEPTVDNLYLRMHATGHNSSTKQKQTLFEYAASQDDTASILIETWKKAPLAVQKQINKCASGECLKDTAYVSTPIGPGVLSEDSLGWASTIVTPTGEQVLVLATRIDAWPEDVLPRLTVIGP